MSGRRTWAEIAPDSLRHYDACPQCAGPKGHTAKYCRACSATVFVGETHWNWKHEGVKTDTASRQRVQRTVSLDGKRCERCSGTATERHHRDGDPHNNALTNIAFVCHRCHMIIDGRLDRIASVHRGKTHCANGHEYTVENTYLQRRGGTFRRCCRICGRAAKQRLRAKCNVKKHGTLTGYTYGCRCDECRSAGTSYARRRRAEKTVAAQAALVGAAAVGVSRRV